MTAVVLPLRDALIASVRNPDEVDLAGEIMRCGGELLGAGENVRQLALLGDQPTIFQLADTFATLCAAERAICVYATARGLRLQGLAGDVVELPSDVEAP